MEIAVGRQGEWRHEHTKIALQAWSQPLSIRGLYGSADWRSLRPGARLWLPGEGQHTEWRQGSPTKLLFLDQDYVEQVLEWPLSRADLGRWRGVGFSSPFVSHLMRALWEDMVQGSPAGPLVGEHLVQALITYLGSGPGPEAATDDPNGVSPRAFQRVLEFIDAHLETKLRVAALAKVAGCTPRRLSRAFQRRQGVLPHEYVLRQRVERAASLIESGNSNLAGVASQVGFADQSQMTRTFRKLLGTTPGRLRSERRR